MGRYVPRHGKGAGPEEPRRPAGTGAGEDEEPAVGASDSPHGGRGYPAGWGPPRDSRDAPRRRAAPEGAPAMGPPTGTPPPRLDDRELPEAAVRRSSRAAVGPVQAPPGTGVAAPRADVDDDDDYAEPIPVHMVDTPKPQPRQSRRRRLLTALLASASILIVIAAALFVIRGLPAQREPAHVEVTIPRGLTARQIGDILAAKHVVNSGLTFRVYAELHGVSNNFQPGRYKMRENMEYKQVVAMLVKGPEKEKLLEVTIPEGFTIRKMGQRLAARTGMDASEFEVLAGTKAKSFRYEFLQSNPTGSLEGYLFPKTYGLPRSADQQWAINKMLAQFEKETAGLDWSRARKRGLTVHQIVTIASLIEREARVPSERRLISAVIRNRLQKGIALRIDATVQYGLPQWKDRLTYDDLKVESPYNTYLHAGLPPGPIASPGLSSIAAALNPANVDYLYYVLTDPRGKHTFTSTYRDFLKAKQGSKVR